MPLFGSSKTKAPAERVVEALRELQQTLHMLTPAEQSEVKRDIPIATQEWQEGLAISLRSHTLASCAHLHTTCRSLDSFV